MKKTAEVACRFWICMLAAVMIFVSLIPASKSLSNEKSTRYRADDGVSRQSLAYIPIDQNGDLDVSLNGEWRFMLNGPEEDFFKPDFDVSGWAAIKVPGNWEMQDFEEPHYKEPQDSVGQQIFSQVLRSSGKGNKTGGMMTLLPVKAADVKSEKGTMRFVPLEAGKWPVLFEDVFGPVAAPHTFY